MSSSTVNGSTQLAVDSLLLKGFLSGGLTEQAMDLSESLLDRSRSIEERDCEMEAWLRMERALLGAVERAHWN